MQTEDDFRKVILETKAKHMIRIDLENAKPGMVLAKPVNNLQNMLLLRERVELSERNIHMLRSWGVSEIWIEGGLSFKGRDVAQDIDALQAAIDKELQNKFANVADHPLMMEIMRLAGKQIKRRLLRREAEHGTPAS